MVGEAPFSNCHSVPSVHIHTRAEEGKKFVYAYIYRKGRGLRGIHLFVTLKIIQIHFRVKVEVHQITQQLAAIVFF